MSIRGDGIRPGTGASVQEWLQLHEVDPEGATHLLLSSSRFAVPRWRGQEANREDVIQETLLRALAHDSVALRRADACTPLLAWLRSCGRNVCREAARARGRSSGEPLSLAEVPTSQPPAIEKLANADEARHAEATVLRLAAVLPRPYGHVLCWRLLHRLDWREVRSALNDARQPGRTPISGRQTRKLIATANEMFDQHRQGMDTRALHRQKYLSSKNPWIGATLPSLSSQSLRGQRATPSRASQEEPCPPMPA
jgi:DNA-directed RNA polymerase specialized sigma24 family protein